jgi:hypothetical protein
MNLNLEWFKKHKVAAGAAILVGLLVLFLIFRKSSGGGSDLGSLAANQQQGQLQLAELNAQESAQQSQLQTQLAASEYQTQAQTQASQDQLAASVLSEALPYQLESPIFEQELSNQASEQTALLPLEQQALTISTKGNNAQLGLAELATLMGEGSNIANKYGSATTLPSSGTTLENPFLTNLGNGLFA